MKKSFVTVLAIALFAFVNLAQAQTVDDVLKKHFKAVGQEKIVAIKTYEVKAKLSQMGQEMPMDMIIKKPHKFIVKMNMQGQEMIQAYDGEKGWMIAPWISAEPQELSGDQLKQAMEQTNLEGELYNYKEKGSTAELVGKVNLDGKEAYKIKLVTSDDNEKEYFIDGKSYFVSKMKAKVSAQGQSIEVEQVMSEYKDYGGMFFATKIETKSPMGSAFILMDEINLNKEFDDSIFKQPAK